MGRLIKGEADGYYTSSQKDGDNKRKIDFHVTFPPP
jgi:hypothetical protein